MKEFMKKIASLILFITACTSTATPKVASITSASFGGTTCYDPANYGAIPDDGLDDRVPMQAALDAASAAGGVWCLGAGRWEVSRAPSGTYNRFAALNTHGHHVQMRGAGPATTISLKGDQGMATTWVVALDPGASDITISDLTIDTSGAFNTEEQTHAIEVGTGVCLGIQCQPIEDISIKNVRFVHPTVNNELKGDCLRLVGTTVATLVRRVQVIGSTFTQCARSGIAVQRNVHALIINGNEFTQPSDQDLDFEPTGVAADLNDTTTITNNVFTDTGGQGDFSVAVGGAVSPMGRVVVSNNVFEGRGLNVYRISDVVISDNVFKANALGSYGVINMGNVVQRANIHHNVIWRTGVAGAMIRVMHQSGSYATDLTIDGNIMRNETAGQGIYIESASDSHITNNTLRFTTAAQFGIYLRSTIAAVDGLTLSGNTIIGPVTYGVYLAASPQPFNDVTLTANQVRGATTGLKCDMSVPGNFHSAISSSANRFGTIACGGVMFIP